MDVGWGCPAAQDRPVPFHMRTAMPLVTSSKMTLPKSSVTAASVLHGDRQMLSPWRLESGSPNLLFKRKEKSRPSPDTPMEGNAQLKDSVCTEK